MLNKLLIIYLLFFGNFLFTILKAEDKTFSYTGSVQTWTVPTGVSSIEVDGYGGMGGHGSSSWNGRGGFGGRLEATISVTAGDTINIYVGEKGGNTKVAGGTTYEPVYNPWTVGDAEGGWNGGGKELQSPPPRSRSEAPRARRARAKGGGSAARASPSRTERTERT